MSDTKKPKFVEALYAHAVSYDIEEIEEELGISWGNVENFGVKWCRLFLQMKDGTTHEILREPGDVDWKRPHEVTVFGDDYEEIEQSGV